jgi:SAM-dependent methyltransferase
MKTPEANQVNDGAKIYSSLVLKVYDLLVLGISNLLIWRCPSSEILAFYNKHITANHLDVGVGTGYFLDRCRFPDASPRLALLDLNPNSLRATANRVARYQPTTFVANVLEPFAIPPTGFDSIGLSYLLHCLPGTMLTKNTALRNLKAHLNPGGILFGTTILGQGVKVNPAARTLMRIYNQLGVFSNQQDNLQHLEHILRDNFVTYDLAMVGCVAFFVGHS